MARERSRVELGWLAVHRQCGDVPGSLTCWGFIARGSRRHISEPVSVDNDVALRSSRARGSIAMPTTTSKIPRTTRSAGELAIDAARLDVLARPLRPGRRAAAHSGTPDPAPITVQNAPDRVEAHSCARRAATRRSRPTSDPPATLPVPAATKRTAKRRAAAAITRARLWDRPRAVAPEPPRNARAGCDTRPSARAHLDERRLDHVARALDGVAGNVGGS